jgi:transcriptional regulator with XRE-family HTH domain
MEVPVTYGALLAGQRAARGVSQRELAERAGVEQSLIAKCELGTRTPAGPDEVLLLAGALGLPPKERDDLLAAAGLWPPAFLQLGPADATLRAVAEALAGPLTPARQELRSAIHSLLRLAGGPRLVAQPPAVPPPAGGLVLRPGRRRRPAGALTG